MNARRADLLKKKKEDESKTDIAKRLNKNNVMCASHFEPSQFTKSKRRLIPTAVPTLFDISNPPKKLSLHRTPPKDRPILPPKPKKKKKAEKAKCSGKWGTLNYR